MQSQPTSSQSSNDNKIQQFSDILTKLKHNTNYNANHNTNNSNNLINSFLNMSNTSRGINNNFPLIQNFQMNSLNSLPNPLTSMPPMPPSLISNNNFNKQSSEPMVSISLSVLNDLVERVKTYETFIQQLFTANGTLNPFNSLNNNFPNQKKDSESQALANLFLTCLNSNNNANIQPQNIQINNNTHSNGNNISNVLLPSMSHTMPNIPNIPNIPNMPSPNISISPNMLNENNSVITSISSKHSDVLTNNSEPQSGQMVEVNNNSIHILTHTKSETRQKHVHHTLNSISRNKKPKSENKNNAYDTYYELTVTQSENMDTDNEEGVSTRSYNKKIGHIYIPSESETKKKIKISHVKDGEYYVCKECGKRYRYLCNLRSHSKVHTDSAHICEYCNKKFGRKANYEEHKRIHTGELPYKCNVCKKRFRQRHGWRDHAKIHHNENFNRNQNNNMKHNLDLPPLTPM